MRMYHELYRKYEYMPMSMSMSMSMYHERTRYQRKQV
jgi:hypothetical protein